MAVVIVTTALCGCSDDGQAGAGADPNDSVYVARYEIAIKNVTHRALDNATLWLNVPNGFTARVSTESPAGVRTIEDATGNRQVVFEYPHYAAGRVETVSIAIAPVLAPRTEHSVDLTTNDPFLFPEEFVESDSPKVVKEAQSLAGDTVSATVRNVVDFVGRLRINESPSDAGPSQDQDARRDGALHTLESGAGSRAGRLFLAIAMLRAGGIPTRATVGFLDDGDGVLELEEADYWPEFFDGTTWRAAPLGAGDRPAHVIAFRTFTRANEIDSEHIYLNLYQGAGLKAEVLN